MGALGWGQGVELLCLQLVMVREIHVLDCFIES